MNKMRSASVIRRPLLQSALLAWSTTAEAESKAFSCEGWDHVVLSCLVLSDQDVLTNHLPKKKLWFFLWLNILANQTQSDFDHVDMMNKMKSTSVMRRPLLQSALLAWSKTAKAESKVFFCEGWGCLVLRCLDRPPAQKKTLVSLWPNILDKSDLIRLRHSWHDE